MNKSGMGKGGFHPVVKPKNTKKTVKRLLNYLGKYKFKIFIVMILVVIATLLTTLATRYMGIAIDEFITKKDLVGLTKVVLLLIGIYFCGS
ncbi:MAG: hypothetical protein ACRCW1_08500, partial [Anaerotignaceae bacterium]